MSTGTKRLLVVFSIVAGSVQPVLAGGGGDVGGHTMTYQYCTEQVVNKGITDVTKFNAEVQKCLANPVTYPPTPAAEFAKIAVKVDELEKKVADAAQPASEFADVTTRLNNITTRLDRLEKRAAALAASSAKPLPPAVPKPH